MLWIDKHVGNSLDNHQEARHQQSVLEAALRSCHASHRMASTGFCPISIRSICIYMTTLLPQLLASSSLLSLTLKRLGFMALSKMKGLTAIVTLFSLVFIQLHWEPVLAI